MIEIPFDYDVKKYTLIPAQYRFSSYVMGVDVGGTNTTVGIAGVIDTSVEPLFSLRFKTQHLPSLIPAVQHALSYAEEHHIDVTTACIGAAGVVSSSQTFVNLTNVAWDFNVQDLIDKTTIDAAFAINDFQATGYGIHLLDPSDTRDIVVVKNTANVDDLRMTKAILGAGTGLGKSILTYNEQNKTYIPIASEGGHGDFPVYDDFEQKLVNFVKQKRGTNEPVIYEELLSGRGIEYIYLFLKELNRHPDTVHTKDIVLSSDKASLISSYRTSDQTCAETMRLFAKFYGRCAKNFVLDCLATGGLYIAGGIAPKNIEIFRGNEFLNEFTYAHQRSQVLENIPIYIIVNYDVGLYGAFVAAMHYEKNIL